MTVQHRREYPCLIRMLVILICSCTLFDPVSGILLRSGVRSASLVCGYEVTVLDEVSLSALRGRFRKTKSVPDSAECKEELKKVLASMEDRLKQKKLERDEKTFCAYMGDDPSHQKCKKELEAMNDEIAEDETQIVFVESLINDWPGEDREKMEKALSIMKDELRQLRHKRREMRLCVGMDPKNVKNEEKCREDLKNTNVEIRERKFNICRCKEKVRVELGGDSNKEAKKEMLEEVDEEIDDLEAEEEEKRFCANWDYVGDDGRKSQQCQEDLDKIKEEIQAMKEERARLKNGGLPKRSGGCRR